MRSILTYLGRSLLATGEPTRMPQQSLHQGDGSRVVPKNSAARAGVVTRRRWPAGRVSEVPVLHVGEYIKPWNNRAVCEDIRRANRFCFTVCGIRESTLRCLV